MSYRSSSKSPKSSTKSQNTSVSVIKAEAQRLIKEYQMITTEFEVIFDVYKSEIYALSHDVYYDMERVYRSNPIFQLAKVARNGFPKSTDTASVVASAHSDLQLVINFLIWMSPYGSTTFSPISM